MEAALALNGNYITSILAYIDPGNGSYIIQLILAGLLGIGYTLKLYWYKIINFFKRLSNKK